MKGIRDCTVKASNGYFKDQILPINPVPSWVSLLTDSSHFFNFVSDFSIRYYNFLGSRYYEMFSSLLYLSSSKSVWFCKGHPGMRAIYDRQGLLQSSIYWVYLHWFLVCFNISCIFMELYRISMVFCNGNLERQRRENIGKTIGKGQQWDKFLDNGLILVT